MFDPPPIVLAISGSDPTSGAGLQGDVLAIVGMGCHPAGVVSVITVQDTRGVQAVFPLDAQWIAAQARCVLEDMPIAVCKIGMMGSASAIEAIVEVLSGHPEIPIVLDPVLASGRGDSLASAETIVAMQELLLPRVTLVTPNSIEARRLAGDSSRDLAQCAARIIEWGCEYVLITGTHENSPDVVNTLYGEHGPVRSDTWPRLPDSYHGSGCTLASACAAALAYGAAVPEAVKDAQDFTWHSLKHAFRAGGGQAIPDRLFWTGEETVDEEVDD